MKKFFMTLAIAAMALCSLTFTSCTEEEIEEGKSRQYGSATITESADKITMKMKILDEYDATITARFKSDKCNYMVLKVTFPNDMKSLIISKLVYDQLVEYAKEYGYTVSMSGTTVTMDLTETMKDVTKADVNKAIEDIIDSGVLEVDYEG